MDESRCEHEQAVDTQQSLKATTKCLTHQTPEELVARSIAPVKKEFLRPPPLRPCHNEQSQGVSGTNATDEPSVQPGMVKEKKSKRQLKRERRQEPKSKRNLCPEIAKTGDVNSCPYNEKCNFSHDVETFKAQKPADLDGECPFFKSDRHCPYGLTCRFYGSHVNSLPAGKVNGEKRISGINGLNKDIQKLLWKKKMQFPKADAKLRDLGLMGPAKLRKQNLKDDGGGKNDMNSGHKTSDNGSCELQCNLDKFGCSGGISEEDEVDKYSESLLLPPTKKSKSEVVDENEDEESKDEGFNATEASATNAKPEAESGLNSVETDKSLKLNLRERKLIDFSDKLYLAPLTTVGNLPFRRVCKVLGADVTCGEMAMCTNLLQGQASEWALLRRHSTENLFGVQICGAHPDTVARAVELIDQECTVDFIDINMGCPIDIVVNKGAGSALLTKPTRMKGIVEVASGIVDKPVTIKVRTGYFEGKNRVDSLIADIGNWGVSAVTVHGRTRQQRYSKLADWDYIYQCARLAPSNLQVLGNGDVFSYLDWYRHKAECPGLATSMIARGALIKPWVFTEIKEQRHWDITSGERLNFFKDFVHFGLEHWGSDTKGVETTRRFLLEWLSYTYRYVPVGILDVVPQRLNWRPPSYYGRDDLETLMASDSAADWIRISEMLLGKVPEGFTFAPKHKSNAYDRAENG